MLNRWIRYFPVIDLLDKGVEPILEVGSGSLGMGEFVSKRFVGCDVAFDSGPRAPTLIPVHASGTRLPFRDKSFDTVLCLDTMEHVPESAREEFVKELLRVAARMLILGAPMGPRASEADRKLHQYFEHRKISEPSWLSEHMALIEEFPQVQYFQEIFDRLGLESQVRRGESALLHRVVIMLEHTPRVGAAVAWLSAGPWRNLLRPFLRLMNRSASYRTYLIIQTS